MENRNKELRDKPAEFMLTPEESLCPVIFYKRNIVNEISSDFTLPDYLPEIRKMLGIRPRLSPISRYIGGNNIEFSGRIDYDMLYVGSDGMIASAPLGADFAFELQPEIPQYIQWDSSNDAFANVEIDMLHCRVTAQRKVNVKCRLNAFVWVCGSDETEGEAKHHIKGAERLSEEICSVTVKRRMSEVFDLTDEISLEGDSENLSPLAGNGDVVISSITRQDNAFLCKGEVNLKILLGNAEDKSTKHLTKAIPFSEEIDANEFSKSPRDDALCCIARGICGEIKMNIEAGTLMVESEVILEADIAESSVITVTKDMFIPGKQSQQHYRDFKFETLEKCANGRAKLWGTIPLSELSMSSESRIIDVIPLLRTEGLDTDGRQCLITGNCKMRIIFKNGDEYSFADTSLPFSFDSGAEIKGQKPSLIASSSISALNCIIDGDNLLCEGEISIPYCITEEHTTMLASKTEIGDSKPGAFKGITVYYPTKNETLWSVAKQFGKPLREIAEANDLPSIKGNQDVSSKGFMLIY